MGYQLARVCMTGYTGARIWQAGFHHPGDTVSVGCLKELLAAAELIQQRQALAQLQWVLKQ